MPFYKTARTPIVGVYQASGKFSKLASQNDDISPKEEDVVKQTLNILSKDVLKAVAKVYNISDNIDDEGGTPISALVVNSSYKQNEAKNDAENPDKAGVQTPISYTRTIFSNVLAARIGPRVETYTVPGVTNHSRITALGFLEFNKRIANFNRFSINATYRPYVGVNRPIYYALKERIGITKSVSTTWRLREDVTINMDLNYTRKREADGKFRFITGGEAVPISYNTIFDVKDPIYIRGMGVGATQPQSENETSKGNPQKGEVP